MHTLPHRQHERGGTVGHGYEADAVCTVTSVSTTTIRPRQVLTEDVLRGEPRDKARETDNVDRSSHRLGKRGQDATAPRSHDGAVPRVLETLRDLHLAAEATAIALSHGAAQLRQGIGTDVTTGPHQTNSEGAGAMTAAPAGHSQTANPRGALTPTETQLHWDVSKRVQIQA